MKITVAPMNKLTHAVTPLIYILKVPGSNIGRDTNYPEERISVCFLSPSNQIPG
jgi:hypothetical protein